MSYTPNNPQIFNAAYCGSLAGIGVNLSVITDSNSADYANPAAIAGAFAIQIDTLWGSVRVATLLDVYMMQTTCAEFWTNHSPSPNNLNLENAATWLPNAKAILALVNAAESYFTAQGITPLPISSGTAVTWADDLAGSSNTNQYVTAITGMSGLGGTVTVTASFALTTIPAHNVVVSEAGSPLVGIAPSTAGYVLTSNGPGSDPSFQANDAAVTWNNDLTGSTSTDQYVASISGNAGGGGTVPVTGALALHTITAHTVLVSEGSSPLVGVSPSTAGYVLTSNGVGSDPSFQPPSGAGIIWADDLAGSTSTNQYVAAISGNAGGGGTVPVTGALALHTITAHTVLVGEGSSPLVGISPSTAGFVLTSNGTSADPSFQTNAATVTWADDLGGSTNTAQYVATISGSAGAGGTVPLNITTLQFAVGQSTPTINQAAVTTASATGQNFTVSAQNATGTTSVGGALTLSSGTGTTVAGSVFVQTGGTTRAIFAPTLATIATNLQLSNYTAHTVLVAEGASAIVGVSPSTAGYVLTSNGTGSDPSFQLNNALVTWADDLAGSTSSAQYVAAISGNAGGGGTVPVTGALALTTITAHTVLVGEGSSPLVGVSPSTAGFVLTSNGTGADPSFQANAATVTWANDLAGSSNTHQYVAAISGNAGAGGTIPINATTLQFAATEVGPTISQASTTTNGQNLTLTPQAATTTGYSGDLIIQLSAPGSGTTEAAVAILRGGAVLVGIQGLIGSPATNFAFYGGNSTPSATNYVFSGDFNGTNVSVNAATSVSLGVGGTAKASFTSSLATINTNLELSNYTAHTVLVAEGASAIVGVSPSTAGFVLTSNGTSADPSFQANAASVTWADDLAGSTNTAQYVAAISGNAGAGGTIPINATTLQFATGQVTPAINQAAVTTASATGQSLTITAQNATGTTSTGGALTLASGTGTSVAGVLNLNLGATNYLQLVHSEPLYGDTGILINAEVLEWGATVPEPYLTQTTLASTSAGSGAAGKTFGIQAQIAQAATGAGNNGGAGGTALFVAGYGGSSGSATGGAGGPGLWSGGNGGAGVTGGGGGYAQVLGGSGGNGTTANGAGGAAYLQGGAAGTGAGTGANGGNVYVQSGTGSGTGTVGTINLELGNTTYVQATISDPQYTLPAVMMTAELLEWVAAASGPYITQAPLASTSSGSGAAGAGFGIVAQAGQAATGASHTGGTGSYAIFQAGTGGNSGSSTAGGGGYAALSAGNSGSGTANGAGGHVYIISGVGTPNGTIYVQPGGNTQATFTSSLATIATNLELSNYAAHTVLVAEGSSAIVGISPSTDGYVLTSNGTSADPSFQANPAAITWADDLAGSTSSAQYVAAISGNAGAGGTIPVNATTLQFGATQTSPGINQATPTSDVATQNLTITSQAPYASATTHKTGGNLILEVPVIVAGASTYPFVTINYGSTTLFQLGPDTGAPTTYGGFYPGGVTPSNTNFAMLASTSGTDTYLNASTKVHLQIGNSEILDLTSTAITPNIANLTWISGVSPTITQTLTTTTSATGQTLTIQAQNATGTTSNGGPLVLTSGTGTTAAGNVTIQTGGTAKVTVAPTLTTFASNIQLSNYTAHTVLVAEGASAVVGVSPSTAGFVLTSNGTSADPSFQANAATVTWANDLAGSTNADQYVAAISGNAGAGGTIPVNATALQFAVSETNPSVSQANVTTGSATGQTLTVQAQNATGSAATGGNLNLTSGTGTSASGQVNLQTGGTTQLNINTANAAITVTPNAFQWAAAANAPIIQQVGAASAVDLTIAPQVASSSGTSGSLTLSVGGPGSGAAEAGFAFERAGNYLWVLQALIGSVTTNWAFYGGNIATPSATNYTLESDYNGTNTTLNAVTSVGLGIGGTSKISLTTSLLSVAVPTIQFASGEATPVFNQAAVATPSTTGQVMTVAAQNATGTTSIGGNLNLSSGSGTSTNGTVSIQVGGTTEIAVTTSTITVTPATIQWPSTVSSPTINQAAAASTSSASGTAGASMTQAAQNGQSATGASHNGGGGGQLTVTSGTGGSSGSATGGAGGLLLLEAGSGGSGTTGGAGGNVAISSGAGSGTAANGSVNVQLNGTNTLNVTPTGTNFASSNVTMATSGTTTLTAAQQASPVLVIQSVSLAGNATLALNGVTGLYLIDVSAVSNVSDDLFFVTNGSGSIEFTSASFSGGSFKQTMYLFYCEGPNNINCLGFTG
jgi:hypothetical protein